MSSSPLESLKKQWCRAVVPLVSNRLWTLNPTEIGAAWESSRSATAKFILVEVSSSREFLFSRSSMSLKALGVTSSPTAGHPLSLLGFELLLVVGQAASHVVLFC